MIFFFENPSRGSPGRVGAGGEGREGVCREFGEGGVGVIFLGSGPKFLPSERSFRKKSLTAVVVL